MAGQVHHIVQQTKHIDLKQFNITYSVKHEMTASSPSSGDMKRHQPLCNLVASPCTGDVRPFHECLDGFFQGIGVDARLLFPELLGCPVQDVLVIGFGGSRQPDTPIAAFRHFLALGGGVGDGVLGQL